MHQSGSTRLLFPKTPDILGRGVETADRVCITVVLKIMQNGLRKKRRSRKGRKEEEGKEKK